MARLGIEKYNSNYSKYCNPLLEANLIGVLNAVPYGLGHIYYLRLKGAKIIAEHLKTDLEELHYVNSTPTLSPQTLFHRTYAIDSQIECYDSCQRDQIDVLFYYREIEAVGSLKKDGMLKRKTRVPIKGKRYIEPDGIFMLDTPKGKKLYCLEFEHKDYTKKSYEKVERHVEALNMKSPSEIYGHDKAHRTLFIYKNPATMEAVMKKMRENIQGIGKWFLFKTYDEVATEVRFENPTFLMGEPKLFFDGWRDCTGETGKIF